MDVASFLALPPTLTIDRVEQSTQGLTASLYATTSAISCPRCGTAGPRVHSRYTRTAADLSCVGQRLTFKLLVRKWICPLDSYPQRIFAEPFPGLVRRYARMTDRLIKALQSIGVTANGADGARLSSSLVMPSTAKTLIRRVLELPLPQEGSVRMDKQDFHCSNAVSCCTLFAMSNTSLKENTGCLTSCRYLGKGGWPFATHLFGSRELVCGKRSAPDIHSSIRL